MPTLNVEEDILVGLEVWKKLTPKSRRDLLIHIRDTIKDSGENAAQDPDFQLKMIACANLANATVRHHAAKKIVDMRYRAANAYRLAIIATLAAFVVALW